MKPLLCFLVTCWTFATFAEPVNGIDWVSWTPELFKRAKSEKKLVILDLEAVWCHWCHVMERETYGQPKVISLIREHFIAVRVDQDARPDLSRRYEDFGWPATIVFASDGTELAKRSGFQNAKDTVALLETLVRNPVPEENVSRQVKTVPLSPFLSVQTKQHLRQNHTGQYDAKTGGWGTIHKFLFGNSEELALRGAWAGNKEDAKRGREALTKALALIDPVWGGVYQYSVGGWKEPHFEKIAQMQARNLFLYALGAQLWKDPRYLKAALSVREYLNRFLKAPGGGYYTSQDADVVAGKHSDAYFKLNDQKRRKVGMPRIDTHRYARENGWYIVGLCALYAATGDPSILDDARAAAEWVIAHRADGEGFRHDEVDTGGPYLGDSLAMAQAFLALYEVSAERGWLEKSRRTARTLARFANTEGKTFAGYLPYSGAVAEGLVAEPSREENMDVARLGNRLFRFTGDKELEQIGLTAMRYLAIPEIAQEYPTAGVLLADQECTTAPVHLTIVGAKSDAGAKALFLEAIRYPTSYKRVEWWDAAEGELPHQDVKYPQLKKAAAFACTEGRCSLPVFDPKALRGRVDELTR